MSALNSPPSSFATPCILPGNAFARGVKLFESHIETIRNDAEKIKILAQTISHLPDTTDSEKRIQSREKVFQKIDDYKSILKSRRIAQKIIEQLSLVEYRCASLMWSEAELRKLEINGHEIAPFINQNRARLPALQTLQNLKDLLQKQINLITADLPNLEEATVNFRLHRVNYSTLQGVLDHGAQTFKH